MVDATGTVKPSNAIEAQGGFRSRCRCGHEGDHELSQHADTVQAGHGACLVPGCGCIKFTWVAFIERETELQITGLGIAAETHATKPSKLWKVKKETGQFGQVYIDADGPKGRVSVILHSTGNVSVKARDPKVKVTQEVA